MLKNEPHRLKQYEDVVKELKIKIEGVKSRIDRFSFVRVALLFLEIAFFVALASAKGDVFFAIWSFLLLVPIAVFVIVVKKQNVLAQEANFLKNLLWVYENEINLINGLPNGYDHGNVFEDELHPYLSDLDIFGRSSLYELINRSASKIGLEELAKHLARANDKTTIMTRQEAIAELTEDIGRTFAFRANLRGHDLGKIEEIKYKLKNQLVKQVAFTLNKPLRAYVKVIPYLTLGLFLGALAVGDELWGILGIIGLFNALLTYLFSKQITQVYYGFSGSSSLLNSYGEAIKWTEEKSWKSTYIKSLFVSEEKVSEHIKALAKIIVAFDARLNFLLYAFLNFFLLWDLRCSINLADWCKMAADKVENGLDRIGYFEELISMATLNYNQADWSFPLIKDEFYLKVEGLGHPLIPQSKRIDNDYVVEQQTTVDIITGSNMAGKSTFLRTMGINMVLAYAGAPVCAQVMRLSIFKLLTYMRIKDNLIESTSTFKAELNRLKMILSEVETHTNAFVFIDEMLRGTNSKDKFDGSKAFIEKLIGLKVPTLFATHDLQLSELENTYPSLVRNFHFDIQLMDGEMDFDYKIKSGPCTQFNAAILLKQIGLSLN
jgi:MutS domain V